MPRLDLQTVRADPDRDADELIVLAATGVPHTSVARGLNFGPVSIRHFASKDRERGPRLLPIVPLPIGQVTRKQSKELPEAINSGHIFEARLAKDTRFAVEYIHW